MTVLLQDDFSESDGTTLHSKSLDVGGTWNDVSSAGWEVRSGRANTNSPNTLTVSPLIADAGDSDFTLNGDVTIGGAGRILGFFVRYLDTSNNWQIRIDNLDNQIQLYERNGGGYTQRASTTFAPNTGTWAMEVTCDGTQISVDVDAGTWTCSYGSATFQQTETECGLLGFDVDVCEIDNFIVEDLGGGTDYTLTADTGSFAISGTAASLEFNRKIAADAGSVAITGTAASLECNRKLSADAGSVVITGTPATLKLNRKLTAATGALAINGAGANLRFNRKLAANAASYLITGTGAGLRTARKLVASSGAYAINGTDATLNYSGAVATPAAVLGNVRAVGGYDGTVRVSPGYDGEVLVQGGYDGAANVF